MAYVCRDDPSVPAAHDDFWSRVLYWTREQKTVIISPVLSIVFLLFAVCVASGQKSQTIKVYYPNQKLDREECSEKVFPSLRNIPKTTAVAKAALEQLFAGPTTDEQARGFQSGFSEKTKTLLLSVNVKNRAAYVNLRNLQETSDIGNFTASCSRGSFFSQIEKTLKQFPAIRRVYFAIEGDPAFFYDWMQIGECPRGLKNCDPSNFIK